MTRNEFITTVRLMKNPVLIMNTGESVYSNGHYLEIWLIDQSNKKDKHLVSTIQSNGMTFEEFVQDCRKEMKKYNEWYDLADNRDTGDLIV